MAPKKAYHVLRRVRQQMRFSCRVHEGVRVWSRVLEGVLAVVRKPRNTKLKKNQPLTNPARPTLNPIPLTPTRTKRTGGGHVLERVCVWSRILERVRVRNRVREGVRVWSRIIEGVRVWRRVREGVRVRREEGSGHDGLQRGPVCGKFKFDQF